MFTHLLVPLDGSPLAESSLPIVAALAENLQCRVTLLHVIERRPPAEIHGAPHLTDVAGAEAYLGTVAGRLPAGTHVASHVHTVKEHDVPRSIADHAAELGADLVVLCTHGRGRLRHRLFGGIAQRVAGMGQAPILLVPPTGARAGAPFHCETMLVPLDGQPAHEQGVEPAASLARACHASLHLLAVVPTLSTLSGEHAAAGQMLPGATSALLELDETRAEGYVTGLVARLAGTGLTVTAEVGRGDPTAIILKTAKRSLTDLIVLGTHGRWGLDAFWSASVAPRIAQKTAVPLLLVPVGEGGKTVGR
jgi:nucleotide-binding universal stress UspA family protein